MNHAVHMPVWMFLVAIGITAVVAFGLGIGGIIVATRLGAWLGNRSRR